MQILLAFLKKMGRRKAGFRRFHKHNESVSLLNVPNKQYIPFLLFKTDDGMLKERKPYLDIVKENEKFIEYYKVNSLKY